MFHGILLPCDILCVTSGLTERCLSVSSALSSACSHSFASCACLLTRTAPLLPAELVCPARVFTMVALLSTPAASPCYCVLPALRCRLHSSTLQWCLCPIPLTGPARKGRRGCRGTAHSAHCSAECAWGRTRCDAGCGVSWRRALGCALGFVLCDRVV